MTDNPDQSRLERARRTINKGGEVAEGCADGCFGMILTALLILGAIYGLVRFVKWAWMN
jgi:hypothetical protein